MYEDKFNKFHMYLMFLIQMIMILETKMTVYILFLQYKLKFLR